MSLTAAQVNEIVGVINLATSEIRSAIMRTSGNALPIQRDVLRDIESSLIGTAFELNTVAVGLAINELQNPAQELKAVIKAAKNKIVTLNTVGKIINVAAGILDVVFGIVSKDPGMVAKAVKSLGKTIGLLDDGE